jgi:hypothetical protein
MNRSRLTSVPFGIWRVGAVSAAIAFAATGCGSSSSATTDTTPAPAAVASTTVVSATATTVASPGRTAPSSADTAKLTDCFKANGVNLPAGSFGAGAGQGSGTPPSLPAGVDQAALQKALGACQQYLPAGAGAGTGAGNNADFQAYFTCLKDNGANVPDLSAGGAPPSIDQNDPTFTKAAAACTALAPAGGPGATATTKAGQ